MWQRYAIDGFVLIFIFGITLEWPEYHTLFLWILLIDRTVTFGVNATLSYCKYRLRQIRQAQRQEQERSRQYLNRELTRLTGRPPE